jgi:CRP-like cAMP-binding protein
MEGARQRLLRQGMKGAGSGLGFGRQEVLPAQGCWQKDLHLFEKISLGLVRAMTVSLGMLDFGLTVFIISQLRGNVKANAGLLISCKARRDDKCRPFWDICHYCRLLSFVNIGAMFNPDYAWLPIFSGLDASQISQILPYMAACQFSRDAVIFEQGSVAEYLYILLAGEVVVNFKPYDGPSLTVARIEPGGVFGWSAALGRETYTSGALAVQDCAAYRIRGNNLSAICEEHPETGRILLERLAGCIAERLRGTHTQILGILSQGRDVDGGVV